MGTNSGHEAPAPPPRGLVTQGLLVALVAGALAGSAAWLEQRHPVAPLDLDGWGHLVTRLQTSNRSFQELFQHPSLWKGPVVPFVFGLCYYLVPVPEAVLAFNVLAFACAAGCLYVAFRILGANGWEAAVPVLLWGAYPPHRFVFGYYYAEPLLALLSALLFLLAARLAVKPVRGLALLGGVLAGILVLARRAFPSRCCRSGCLAAVSRGQAVPGMFLLLLPRRAGRVRTLAPPQHDGRRRPCPLHHGGRKDPLPGDLLAGRRPGHFGVAPDAGVSAIGASRGRQISGRTNALLAVHGRVAGPRSSGRAGASLPPQGHVASGSIFLAVVGYRRGRLGSWRYPVSRWPRLPSGAAGVNLLSSCASCGLADSGCSMR